MHIITQLQFINRFKQTQQKTYKEFVQTAKVKTSAGLIPLKQYVKNRKIPPKDIRELYIHIINRDDYLSRFYEKSLLPVIPISIVEPSIPIARDAVGRSQNSYTYFNNNEQVKYKNIIRNMYYIDILKNTHSGLENLPSFLMVLEDLYLRDIIDYKILTPSARHYTNSGRIGSVFSSLFFRASIMNPYLVFSLNHKVLKGERIFTPTLGWSSYC